MTRNVIFLKKRTAVITCLNPQIFLSIASTYVEYLTAYLNIFIKLTLNDRQKYWWFSLSRHRKLKSKP